jgi:hypothetical protein
VGNTTINGNFDFGIFLINFLALALLALVLLINTLTLATAVVAFLDHLLYHWSHAHCANNFALATTCTFTVMVIILYDSN